MGALRPDLMVGTGANPTDPVTYLALVDEGACDSTGGVESGPQNSSAAAGAAANSKDASVSYSEAIVTVSKASPTAPMIVKAWITLKLQVVALKPSIHLLRSMELLQMKYHTVIL